VAALAFLIIGVVCSLIARALLLKAAFGVSKGWGFGVLLPFGPLLFRLNYAEEARPSFLFRLATLPCFLLYVLLGPGPVLRHDIWKSSHISAQPKGFAFEKAKVPAPKKLAGAPGPTVELTPSAEERRASNTREFEHLRAWADALRLKKRDLLHSDAAGNVAYVAELAQYNAALAKANGEKALLWPGTK
jgi:hypothetical protein